MTEFALSTETRFRGRLGGVLRCRRNVGAVTLGIGVSPVHDALQSGEQPGLGAGVGPQDRCRLGCMLGRHRWITGSPVAAFRGTGGDGS